MVMSIDRYLAINHAMNSIANKLRSVRAVRLVSIVVWTICFSAVTHILWTAHVLPCDTCAIKFSYDQEQDASGNYLISSTNSEPLRGKLFRESMRFKELLEGVPESNIDIY